METNAGTQELGLRSESFDGEEDEKAVEAGHRLSNVKLLLGVAAVPPAVVGLLMIAYVIFFNGGRPLGH